MCARVVSTYVLMRCLWLGYYSDFNTHRCWRRIIKHSTLAEINEDRPQYLVIQLIHFLYLYTNKLLCVCVCVCAQIITLLLDGAML